MESLFTLNSLQMKETFYFYILHSFSCDKFYLGYTHDLEARLIRHNQKSKGFTGAVNDWSVIYSEVYETKAAAYAREREVKKWKSRKRILALIEQRKNADKRD